MSRVAGVADDVASDVRDNAEPTADAAADKIQAVAHESGQQIKRVADVASKQVQSVHLKNGLNDFRTYRKSWSMLQRIVTWRRSRALICRRRMWQRMQLTMRQKWLTKSARPLTTQRTPSSSRCLKSTPGATLFCAGLGDAVSRRHLQL